MDRAGVEGHRRLERDEAEELEEVVLHHVPKRAGLFVVGAARLDADRLRDGDLDLGDVAPVPQGLEDAVGEPKHQEILDGLLAEIVIDPVDLLLAKDPAEAAIERTRALVVVSERLLDDDAGPTSLGARQARGAEVLDDRVVEARRCREVEETVRGAGPRVLDVFQRPLERGVERGIRRVAVHVREGGGEPVPHVGGRRLHPRELADRVAHAPPKLVVGHLAPRAADDRERLRKGARRIEAPEGGDELPARQVAGGPEDHQRERLVGYRRHR